MRLHEYLFVLSIYSNDENIIVNSYVGFKNKKLKKKDYLDVVEITKRQYNVNVVSIVNVIYIRRYKDE